MYDPSQRDDTFTERMPPVLRQPGHPMWLPLVCIAINVGIWLWSVFSGVHAFSPEPVDLEAWGGNRALLTLSDQPWRLFTSMFVHAGGMHLFFNMYFLFQIGPLLALRKGSAGFAVVYLGGGLLASMASAGWQLYRLLQAVNAGRPLLQIVSVGASGAIMAVAGALACSLALSHWRAQNGARGHAYSAAEKHLMQSLLQVIAVNVAMGFFISGLDQAAHLGGLLAGALLGLIVPNAADRLPAAKRWLRVVAAAIVSLMLLAAAWWLLTHL